MKLKFYIQIGFMMLIYLKVKNMTSIINFAKQESLK